MTIGAAPAAIKDRGGGVDRLDDRVDPDLRSSLARISDGGGYRPLDERRRRIVESATAPLPGRLRRVSVYDSKVECATPGRQVQARVYNCSLFQED
jgi:hypothetical protein